MRVQSRPIGKNILTKKMTLKINKMTFATFLLQHILVFFSFYLREKMIEKICSNLHHNESSFNAINMV